MDVFMTIIMVNKKSCFMNKIRVPEIDEVHCHFDDGKISKSRMSRVRILGVIPRNSISEDTEIYKKWCQDRLRFDWLMSYATDYFIIAKDFDIKDDNGKNVVHYYTRTNDCGWYSFGDYWNDGRLDADDEMFNKNFLNDKTV